MTPEDRARTGWDAAVTLVTPIERRPRVRSTRRSVLAFLDRSWLIELGRRLGVVNIAPLTETFKRLNHLHYARWSLVNSLPRTSPDQPKETGAYTLLLFTSHFDFGWRRYLGTFIEASGDRLRLLWADAPSWVSPVEGYARFERFVEDQRVEHAHLFAAYPNWSCNDVRAALRIYYECESDRISQSVLAAQHWAQDGADGADVRDQARVRRLQHCLGKIPPIDPDYVGMRAALRPEVPHPTQGVTYLIPIPVPRTKAVRRMLHNLPFGPASPFAAVPGTHFARMAVIDHRYFKKQPRVDALRSTYLMLSAEIDGEAEPWLTTLLRDDQVRNILSLGWGMKGDIAATVQAKCRIAKSVEFIDYPTATVAEIFEASDALEANYEELTGWSG
jgi:hypothetical protein